MYKPTILPQVKEKPLNLSDVKFGIVYSNKFVDPKNPNIEPAHIHDYQEIFFNVSSNVSFLVNNRLYAVPQGDAIFSRDNEVHVCVYNAAQAHEYFCLWIDAEKETINALFPFLKSAFSPLFTFDDETKIRIHTLLKKLYFTCQDSEDRLKKTAYFLQILTLFQNPAFAEKQETKIPVQMQKIIDDVHLNFAEIDHVNKLSERHFVSPATLNRWFRKYIHLSPREFLESKKLAHAAKLLSQGASVTDACLQSGFSDCSHFIVLFKKKFSETPLKYKQKFY